VPEPVSGEGWEARVFLGSLLGTSSPVRTYSPLLGAELRLRAGTTLTLAVDPAYEHGLLLDSGSLAVDGEAVKAHELGFLDPGRDEIEIVAAEDALFLLLGGPPFGEQIVMWWNFIGRDHDEIVAAREDWEAQRARFGSIDGHDGQIIPAPPMPSLRLKPRVRH